FWLGRYIERTESLARVLRCVLRSLQEELGSRFHLGVLPIIGSFLNEEQERRLRVASEDAIDLRLANRYLDHMVHDLDCLGSLAQNFTHLRRISTAVKERLSLDAWALLRAGVEGAAPIARRADAYVDDPRLHQIENILTALAGFSGMVSENMTRGPSWTFLEVGRRIERSLALTNLTYSALIAPGAHEESTLAKLLDCADSVLTYRRRYLTALQVRPVLDLVLRDESNPRSLAFQVNWLRRHLPELPHHRSASPDEPIRRAAAGLFAAIDLFPLDRAVEELVDGERVALATALDELAGHLARLSEAISARYFSVIHMDGYAGGSDIL
ncbi:MAG: alpha-E domain-containing protein, partial [Verrucomicrobiota bacterium]